MDLSIARDCIKTMKDRGYHDADDYKIGILKKPIMTDVSEISGFPSQKEGTVVLYKRTITSDEKERARLENREPRPNGRVTIERPLTQEEIAKNMAEGSGIMTTCTCIWVPEEYVKEVTF